MSKLIPFLETIFMNRGGTPEHWKVSLKVLNEKAEESKHFIAFIKNKLKDLDIEVQSMALDLVDFFMDEGKMPLFTQVSSKDFLMTLVNILKNRGASVIQEKILYLLKKWGMKFEKQKDIIPNFTDIYEQLKKNKTLFPDITTPGYYKYILGKEEIEPKSNNFVNSYNKKLSGKSSNVKDHESDFPISEDNKGNSNNLKSNNDDKNIDYSYKNYVDVKPEKFPNKYKSFVTELNVWMDNITLANETIENADYKADIDEYLRSIINAIRAAEKQLISIIQSGFEEEDLMNFCLIINDDINKTLTRYECLKKKKKPEPFLTGFLENDSINPKFKVKKPENKQKQVIPKINNNNSQQKQKNQNENLLDIQNQSNPVNNNSNMPLKDVNDIFDLFGSSLKVSDNNNKETNLNMNKFNQNGFQNHKENELNPNNIIDLVTNLTQNQQKSKQNENIIDLSQLNNNNNPNLNNIGNSDVKISNEPTQNKKINDLEEKLKLAYSNNTQNENHFMNQPQNNQNTFQMPMYGLPANGPFNNQYQNPSYMNPNPMMPMPIINPNLTQNTNQYYGIPQFPMDVNGNMNNQMPMNIPNNDQSYPQINMNQPNPYIPQQNSQNLANNNMQANYPPQQNNVNNNYPDFFN